MARPLIVQQIDDRVEVHGDVMFGSLQIGQVSEEGEISKVGLVVHDLNGQSITPQSFGDSVGNLYFQLIPEATGDTSMKGILHVKGAPQEGYAAWELAGNADSYSTDRLFYRQGIDDTWGDWKEIAFLDSTIAFADRLTSLEVGAPNIPVYFTDGKPVSTEYDLHILMRPDETVDIPSVSTLTIADKLAVDAGTPARPIYFANGIPVVCNETLIASITGTAELANILSRSSTFKVLLSSNNASTAFNGTQDILDIGVSGILRMSNGGTGTHLTPSIGGVIFGGATSYESTLAGQTGQLLQSNGQGPPTWTSGAIGANDTPIYMTGGKLTASSASIGGSTTPVYMVNGVLKACSRSIPSSSSIYVSNGNTSTTYYVLGSASTGSYTTFYKSSVYFQNNVLYGAAWNDYAEFRELKNKTFSPGQVVVENGDDTVSLSTKRLQPVGYIISDTYGIIVGKKGVNGVPVGVTGRVLAIPYENKTLFHVGNAVCSGPNGTVSLMTKDEVIAYPECVLGYVSSIPEYKVWGENNILVNDRIWIRIK